MNRFWQQAHDMEEELVRTRRELHQIPETGLHLPRTSAYVMERLEALGLTPQRIGESGVTACIGGKRSGKVFLLRADMDALPMPEDTGLPFASTEERAHTCGHDMHTSMLLGAAKILKDCEEELEGTVKLMFQPAEETMEGALALIEAGILENPPVDAAMGLHVIPGNLHVGTVAWSGGPVLASSDIFTVTITGKPGHGAFPQNAVDALNIAAHTLIALQTVQAREVNTKEPLVLSICTINGGTAANIFPETVTMRGTIRAFSEDTRQYAKKRLVEICTATAELFRGQCQVAFAQGIPAVVNDAPLAEELGGYVSELDVKTQPLEKQMGSEDFAAITQKVPAVFFNIGAGGVEDIYNQAACHHPKVVYHEGVLPIGTAMLAGCAFRWLEDHR